MLRLCETISLTNGNGPPSRSVTPQRLGFILTQLRVERAPRAANNARLWLVTRDDVKRWLVSYASRLPVAPAQEESEPEAEPES